MSVNEAVDNFDQDVATKRRMPDYLRRFLIKMQGGKMYLPAAFRIVWMRDDPEVGDRLCTRTKLIEGGHEPGFATVYAEIVDRETGTVLSTAHKTEEKKDFPAGWVEKAETGAISRALSNLGFGTAFDETILGYDQDGHVTDSPQGRPGTKPAPKPTAPTPKAATDADRAPYAATIQAVAKERGTTAADLCEAVLPGVNRGKYTIEQWKQVADAAKTVALPEKEPVAA